MPHYHNCCKYSISVTPHQSYPNIWASAFHYIATCSRMANRADPDQTALFRKEACFWLQLTCSPVQIPLVVEISSWLYGVSLHSLSLLRYNINIFRSCFIGLLRQIFNVLGKCGTWFIYCIDLEKLWFWPWEIMIWWMLWGWMFTDHGAAWNARLNDYQMTTIMWMPHDHGSSENMAVPHLKVRVKLLLTLSVLRKKWNRPVRGGTPTRGHYSLNFASVYLEFSHIICRS